LTRDAGAPTGALRAAVAFARRPRRTAVAAALATGAAAAAVCGPVAGIALALYALLAVGGWLAHRRADGEERTRASAIETLATVAGDLRAGLPIMTALGDASSTLNRTDREGSGPAAAGVAARRLAAAVRVAELVGAPLADLLDRVERDLRAVHLRRQSVRAETAGVRATAYLLAALPTAGIALGYGMGANPLHTLLYTPLGAACALAAIALQCGGLVWTSRMCARAVGGEA
jgi:tight adherence protein B